MIIICTAMYVGHNVRDVELAFNLSLHGCHSSCCTQLIINCCINSINKFGEMFYLEGLTLNGQLVTKIPVNVPVWVGIFVVFLKISVRYFYFLFLNKT